MKKASIYFYLMVFPLFSVAKTDAQKIGEWISYLPYQSGKTVTQSETKVYYGTEWSILQVDKEDFSTERMSKVDGLSDIGIDEIAYDIYKSQLVIAYSNGNIDILKGDRIFNLPNIKLNTDLTGNKTINDIHISDNRIYLSTGFGLVTISSDDLLFGFTTFTDIPINDAVTFNNQIYIATDEGVYFAPIDGSQNLIDFSLWKLIDNNFGLPILYESTGVSVFQEKLYFIAEDILYQLEGNGIIEIWPSGSSNASVSFLSSEGSNLMIGVTGQEGRGDILFYNGNDFVINGRDCSDRIQDIIEDQFGRVWYADEFEGFRSASSFKEDCQIMNINSPFSHKVSDISLKNDNIYVASGGVKDNYDYSFTRKGIYIYSDGSWQNINQNNEDFFSENDLLNFLKIEPHPSKEETYFGTYWGGLLRHDDLTGSYTLYNDTNSALEGTIGDIQRERVTGLLFDKQENLWVSSFGSSRPLALFSQGEEWFNFSLGVNKNIIDIAQDREGYLWLPTFGNNGGCYVYDPGDDLSSSGDDRLRFISSANSNLTSNIVNTVNVDLEGAVWIGTAEGPVVFDCGSDPFNTVDCQGDRIKVVQDSIVAFLLADQDVLAIAVDGGNQKWFGTRKGIFVQSPGGEEEVFRFTTDNSPLFDNRIRDLTFNNNTGEMLIGTDRGLQSFITPTTGGEQFHSKQEVLVYPNPVEPNYRGPIAIKGLVRDALVQITDVNGNLITEVRAQGGQAVWYGKDLNGKEVSTGVYLIFSSDEDAFDSPNSFVTKVMIIR